MNDAQRATSWTASDAARLVRDRFDADVSTTTWIGSGSWSDCFAFASDDRNLVIRIGPAGDDFALDAFVAHAALPQLNVPDVFLVGSVHDDHFAVSARVPGEPLEHAEDWQRLVEPAAHLLDALRATDLPEIPGWGRWTPQAGGQASTWRSFLMAVNTDPVGTRIHGWKAALATSTSGHAAFQRGYGLLEATIVDEVPRSLVHNDLINRNVHVADSSITGVFDWGNSLLGDHLYDLAVMIFWQPWLPNVQANAVVDAAMGLWAHADTPGPDGERRLRACLVHIALEHIAYHAFRHDWDEVQSVIDRLDQVTDHDGFLGASCTN